jgi:hypothetical protein
VRRLRGIVKIAAALVAVWIVFVGAVYALMCQPPATFAAAMAKIQYPVFILVPFEPLWFRARAGVLRPGDPAPDFRLTTVDKSAEVTLSSFRGVKPVVLVFGSYT